MKLNKNLLAVAITSITALTLFGCGTEKQDGGNGSSSAFVSPGIAVDGPVARGLVFLDTNGNLKKDSFEPSALTDNDGYYNANGPKDVYYCNGWRGSDNGTSTFVDRPEFCLTMSLAQYQQAAAEGGSFIIMGGYDLYTGEPFEGSMSIPAKSAASALSYSVWVNGDLKNIAITPLSSILGNNSANDTSFFETSLAGLLGLAAAADQNYLDPKDPEGDGQADNFEANKFSVTYKMHKFVTVVADWVKDRYPEIGENDGLPGDISPLIYQEFESFIKADHIAAWTGIATKIIKLYENANVTLPTAPTVEQLADLYFKIGVVDTAIATSFGNSGSSTISGGNLGSDLTFANVKARVRGVEVVVSKILRGSDHTNALAALSNPTYLANLAGNTADGDNINFTRLVEFDGADFATESTKAIATGGSSLSSDLAGKMLDFEDDGSDETIDSKAAIFFTGDEGATRGDIHLCLKYEDGSDQSLAGDYISGTWETLAALNNTVMLRLNYLGGRSAVLKKIGETGNANETEYRFDFNGEISKFTSDQGFNDTGDTPVITSSAACKTYVGAPAS